MQVTLRVALVIYAVALIIYTTRLLKKGKIPEKYSFLWYAFALVVLLVGVVPQFLEFFSELLGFETMVNFVIGVLIVLLTLVCMALSVMIAGQRKKTTLLIQEVSMLKKELKEKK